MKEEEERARDSYKTTSSTASKDHQNVAADALKALKGGHHRRSNTHYVVPSAEGQKLDMGGDASNSEASVVTSKLSENIFIKNDRE